MLQVCKQTYLYTAVKNAIQDLGLQSYSQSLQTTLLTLLQTKFESILIKEKQKKQDNKKTAQAFNASQILESEFPIGNEEQNIMKYSSTLYNMEMPKTISSHFKVKKNQICILECFSDQNIKDKSKGINKSKRNDEENEVNTQKSKVQLQKMKERQQNHQQFAEMKVTIQKMIKAQSQRQSKKIKQIKMLVNKRLRSSKKSKKNLSKKQANSSLNKSLVKKKH